MANGDACHTTNINPNHTNNNQNNMSMSMEHIMSSTYKDNGVAMVATAATTIKMTLDNSKHHEMLSCSLATQSQQHPQNTNTIDHADNNANDAGGNNNNFYPNETTFSGVTESTRIHNNRSMGVGANHDTLCGDDDDDDDRDDENYGDRSTNGFSVDRGEASERICARTRQQQQQQPQYLQRRANGFLGNVKSSTANGNGDNTATTAAWMSARHSQQHRVDKREETSKWIEREFDDNEEYDDDHDDDSQQHDLENKDPNKEHQQQSNAAKGSLLAFSACDFRRSMRIQVRVMPSTFSPGEFVCQRVDLLKAYDKMHAAMNDHYERIKNATRSLERDTLAFYMSNGSLTACTNNNTTSDTLGAITVNNNNSNNNNTSANDLFVNKFRVGDYCASLYRGSWMRSRILDITPQATLIECVDDFRTERVPLHTLEKLRREFTRLPRVAFRCRLAGIESMRLLTLDLKQVETLKRLIASDQTKQVVEIVDLVEDECGHGKLYEVDLFVDGRNIIECLQ